MSWLNYRRKELIETVANQPSCIVCKCCGYDLRQPIETPYYCIDTREYHSGMWGCSKGEIAKEGEPYAEVILEDGTISPIRRRS